MSKVYRVGNAHEPRDVTELWAWIVTEENGGEGVAACAMNVGGEPYFMPLVGADLERIQSLEPYALHVQNVTGCPVKMKRFKLVEE